MRRRGAVRNRVKKKAKKKASRRRSIRTYAVFLGLQFKSKKYCTGDIVDTVQRAARMAEGDLQGFLPGIRLQVQHHLEPGTTINAQIISMVRNAAAVVLEVSDRNPNVYFEMGLAHTSPETRPLILCNKDATKDVLIASDVRDVVRLNYPDGDVSSVDGSIARHIRKVIKKQIQQEIKGDEWARLKRIWSGGTSTRQITVVCPELPRSYRPKYAAKTSSEFVNLARFGDLDALVEVLTLLPKLFPNAEVKYVTSEEVQRPDKQGNLIVIGGPDFNTVAEELLEEEKFPFEYCTKDGKSSFRVAGTNLCLSLNTRKGRVCQDYGLFARFPNPLNKRNTVVMIGGLQTFGVLGAAQAFGMNASGKRNTNKVMQHCSGTPRFAVLIPVTVSSGQPSYNNIDTSTLRTYPW